MEKFLLIEDTDSDIEVCKSSIKVQNLKNPERCIELKVAKSFEEAIAVINEEYNGIIVDIKLDGKNSGNEIIKNIINEHRLPLAIMTGTSPDIEIDEDICIKIFTKGESTYEEIINYLMEINSTGLFNVLGGKGIIAKTLNKVFWENLYPQLDTWNEHKKNDVDTESILLRYAISHIHELIDETTPCYVTEEMYISPPISENIKTGSIVESKDGKLTCVVLSPPCDLVIYKGKIKTSRIMLCEIESSYKIINQEISEIKKKDKRKTAVEKIIKNNGNEYYHWLPGNTLFEGGLINFRKVITYSPSDLENKFNKSGIRIQESFTKNILRRFSGFYARQGQPDFSHDLEVEKMLKIIDDTNLIVKPI